MRRLSDDDDDDENEWLGGNRRRVLMRRGDREGRWGRGTREGTEVVSEGNEVWR